MRSLLDRYNAITKYVSTKIAYDYIRAITIPKKNGLPNVARCWDCHMGICLDIASLTAGMLRAVSVPCNLVIGWADGQYHAWVEARIDGKRYLYDHDDPKGTVKTYKRERMY
jgi:transglutaminase-like putative cysteine protease